ncbi:ABC transporter substrate-binding protein [Reyranella sp. CPCC 100927]|uniref:ABC transporter substrate-binding protein n=1 Tax=Reyranella sp. CPCC 100927 TaxID=2599616 RepID=UPI0011B72623|nr:ABC transporter substrate-binding protein [Reyranella sp. CPCC 100927]TWT10229.1 ABC transporter substrate-binding protein [Reyranella sp. CPCC 100927]
MNKMATVGALLLATAATPVMAQITDDVVKVGVLTDLSSLYADINGPGAVAATQMAIDDAGGTVLGKKIEIVTGDVQNKPDVAATIAGRWYDSEKVDVILGAGGSASSIAGSRVGADRKRIFLAIDPASSDITGKLCNAYTVQWVYDTVSQANGTGSAVVKAGGKSWYFITADYAFGHALERDVSAVVTANGGTVLGSVRHPINTADFSSFLLQAQASKAQIIGLANAGGDTINAIKQAAEFGIAKGGQKLAGLVVFISDIHSLGLERAQGLQLTEAFYWDRNDDTRAFAKRFAAKMGGKMPTSLQAGYYSATKLYLKTIKDIGTDDADKVMAKMKSSPADDEIFGKSVIRADGRKVHDMYLFEVKKPSESKGPYDYYKPIATIPGDQAFRPMDKGDCPLVTKK